MQITNSQGNSSIASFLAFLFLTIALGVSSSIQAQELSDDPAVIAAGEELFNGNCTACHRINERLVGPALRDVHIRRDLDWILPYVKNPQKMINAGDPIATELFEEYQVVMTAFPFNDDQILSIISYIKAESEKPIEEGPPPGDDDDDDDRDDTAGISQAYFNAIIIGFIAILVILLVVLFLIINVLTRFLKEKELDETDKEVVDQRMDIQAMVKSNAFLGFAAFFFTAIVLKSAIDGLFTVGVQQGYAPTQPIAFSHEIHAGQYEIDCNYCHTGVRKSKNANIPSTNICMNCHSMVQKESPEIQKLYAAVENNTPIEWVRVHNLPDLAYFNHAQHVEVGGIECETCHGPIEEMEVVRQHSELTMGWCINCHRETNLNTKGNAYYDKLVELHSEVSKEPMKVEDNGGLECARCHY
ncbi:MAG: c-type cytochrome [Cyclobacteriaceae bacterium]